MSEEKNKNEGWICPKCGRVLSPYIITCDCEQEKLAPCVPMPYVPPIYPPKSQPYRYYPDWTYRPPYWDRDTMTVSYI